MKKYYLISNATHLNQEAIDSLNIEENDEIILFNHSHPLKFISHKNKILFIRETDNILTGFNDDLTQYKKIYFFITSNREYFKEKFDLLDSLNINYDIFDINEFIKNNHSDYPINNLPTCGFLGYIYLTNSDKYDANINNVYLVGFTGHHSNGHEYDGVEHNYNYEQKYYKKYNIKILHKR
jgi:hypothetical protein